MSSLNDFAFMRAMPYAVFERLAVILAGEGTRRTGLMEEVLLKIPNALALRSTSTLLVGWFQE